MAKKKDARISINAFEKVSKEMFQDTVTEEWFGSEVIIRKTIPLLDVLEFVQDIVSSCFLDDGSYVPEVMDFSIKAGILTRYANFTLPENLEKQYWLIYSTDAVDTVVRHINKVQLEEIIESANRKIDYMCDTNITAYRKMIDEMRDSFTAMAQNFEQAFGGVNTEDIQKLVNSIDNGKIDEDRLVSAYVDLLKSEHGEDNKKAEQ